MPANDSPDILVARFLKANNYKETFQAFIKETNLDASSITHNPTDLTIEKILQEKKLYDLALKFEKTDISDGEKEWSVPYPTTSTTLTTATSTSNILSVLLTEVYISHDPLPVDNGPHPPTTSTQVIIATSADKALRIYTYTKTDSSSLIRIYPSIHPAPILSVEVLHQKWLITASMAGDVAIVDVNSGQVVDRIAPHQKYIVKITLSDVLPYRFARDDDTQGEDAEDAVDTEVKYIAAASYDRTVSIHAIISGGGTSSRAPEFQFVQTISFPENVEDVLFTPDYRDGSSINASGHVQQVLIATIRDSPCLYYHSFPSLSSSTTSTENFKPPKLAFDQKLALTSTETTWMTYTPTSLAPHPHHPHLLAFTTSSLPSPKLVILNMRTGVVHKEFKTSAELAPYSTGVVCWRNDAGVTGVWVNSDDGIVRGLEVMSGIAKGEIKVCAGRKVRCLCAGVIEGREVVVSGGFDGGLKVWEI